MTGHTEDALRCPRVLEIVDLVLAISTSKTARAEGLFTGEDGQIFDLVATRITAVGAVVADE